MHGNHIFGLMGLLASIGLAGSAQDIDIYGRQRLADYLRACAKYSYTNFANRVRVHPVSPGILYEDEEFTVSCQLLKHRIPAHGYRIAEKDRPGRFDVEKANALGIPPGPIYGKLKKGETVTLVRWQKNLPVSPSAEKRKIGRKIAYCTDTIFCEGSIELAENADVLIHEATFAHQDAGLAFESVHSTSTMAAQVASAAQVKLLLMTHFSPRYLPGNSWIFLIC
jgi:ribonuclease Z